MTILLRLLPVALALCTQAAPLASFGIPHCASTGPRSDAIKEAFQHAYLGYKRHAWGHDELLPKSNGSSNSRNGWGASIVDGLDTMYIMGLENEYREAVDFISKIDFKHSTQPVKGFETGIRYLGGLLAAHDLEQPNSATLLQKATELTNSVLLPLFDNSPSKAPVTNMDLQNMRIQMTDTINLAEFGSYSLEFTRLSQLLNDDRYASYANNLVDRILQTSTDIPGLYPTTWDTTTFTPKESSLITIGGGADSFYEYLIKNHLLLTGGNGAKSNYLDAWERSVDSIQKYLVSPVAISSPDNKFDTTDDGDTDDEPRFFVGSLDGKTLHYSSQELICFWPGNILLGTTQITDANKQDNYREFAHDFMLSCTNVWKHTATGIAPESWQWKSNKQPLLSKRDARRFTIENGSYDLRPETLESLFYFYRLTGDSKYQDIAWDMFQAINKYTRTPSGFTRISNVDTTSPELDDFQESYLFAETLKYLYLTFVDKNCVSLDEYVYNTEGHPFRLPRSVHVQS